MPEIRLLQGDLLRELGKHGAAILAYDEIVEKWPTSYLVDRAWGCKGDCQYTLGSGGTNDVTQEQSRYKEALVSYQTVIDSPTASAELKLQATWKQGRSLAKMGRSEEALESYLKVVYFYLGDWSEGGALGEVWFSRAAFSAGDILEREGDYKEALRIYQRVVEAGVQSAPEARKRIQKIRLEHWMPF